MVNPIVELVPVEHKASSERCRLFNDAGTA